MTDNTPELPIDENQLIAERRGKLHALRLQGIAYPNDFTRADYAQDLQDAYADKEQWTTEALQGMDKSVQIAGRLMAKRVMGKASFAQLQDMSGRIQLYLAGADLGDSYEAFKHWDVGDIIGVSGVMTRTKTGELSIKGKSIRLLTKSLRPLPDKWHGLSDVEQRYRQRYVDLIVNSGSARSVHQALAGNFSDPQLARRAALPGSRNADDALHPRWRHRQTVHDPSQRARS